MEHKVCGICDMELLIQEHIYCDVPTGSNRCLCQTCYDIYMIDLSGAIIEKREDE